MNSSILSLLGHVSHQEIARRYGWAIPTTEDRDVGARLRSAVPGDGSIVAVPSALDHYRAFHARTLRQVTPLLVDVCALEGLDLDELSLRLRPQGEWRRWLCGSTPHGNRRKASYSAGPVAVVATEFLYGGLILRRWNAVGGALGIRVSPQGLEIGAQLGSAHVRTLGGVADLTLGIELPETLKDALSGRPVDDLVDHGLFAARGYVVERVVDHPSPRAASGLVTRLVLRTGMVPWSPPWIDPDAESEA